VLATSVNSAISNCSEHERQKWFLSAVPSTLEKYGYWWNLFAQVILNRGHVGESWNPPMASHHEVVILTKGLLPSARSRSLWCMQVSQKLPTHGATGSVGMKWFWLSSAVEKPEEDRLLKQSFFGGMWRLWRSRVCEHGHSDALSALSHSKVGVFNHMILDELQQPHCDVSGMMVHEGNHL